MRHYNRFIILAALLGCSSAQAVEVFVDALEWRATETNDWVYVNSLTTPNQTLSYRTIDFNYSPGIRAGLRYVNNWDLLFSYSHYYTTTHDSTTGNLQPSFVGSVTAKPSHAYLYRSGQVSQSINYNIFDLDFGQQFHPASSLMIHPFIGVIGGWINQSITANYQGTTYAKENITNNFTGVGPKFGLDTSINLFNYHDYQPQLVASFSSAYLLGNWQIKDITNTNRDPYVIVATGSSHSMGALTVQGSMGLQLSHNNLAVKIVYEIGDWFNQSQFFDNDTGTHNNDLILQGVTLGIVYGVG